MRAGELDRVITIQRQADPDSVSPPLRDAMGGVIESWVNVHEDLPAGKRAASGREIFAAGQNARQIDTVFVIRWVEDITTDMRVLFDDLVYDIQTCHREIGRREGLLIEARVRV